MRSKVLAIMIAACFFCVGTSFVLAAKTPEETPKEADMCEYVLDVQSVKKYKTQTTDKAIAREPSEDETTVAFHRSDWKLILVNKQHFIPENYSFTLGTISGNKRCDVRVVPFVRQMFEAAKEDGVNLVVCSPYRNLDRQEVLFERKIKNYMKNGMSYLDAYKETAQAVTLPGTSEHQIGLALDIVCDTYASLNEGFGETEAGIWLSKHSWEYGFILRYPKGKKYMTGIEYEPWHFRYVGKEAAKVIYEEGITLEEFVMTLPE